MGHDWWNTEIREKPNQLHNFDSGRDAAKKKHAQKTHKLNLNANKKTTYEKMKVVQIEDGSVNAKVQRLYKK